MAEHLGLEGDGAVRRAIRLVGALSEAELVRVSDGTMGPSDSASRWTSDDLETAVTSRRDVVAPFVAGYLLPVRVTEEVPMRTAVRALQRLAEVGLLGRSDVEVLAAQARPGDDDLAAEVHDLLALVAAEGLLQPDGDVCRPAEHLTPCLAAVVLDVDAELQFGR